MQQLQALSVVENLVGVQVRLLASARLQRRVLRCSGDEENLVRVRVERDDRDREGGFVVLEVKLEDGLGLGRIRLVGEAESGEGGKRRTATGSMIRRQDPQVPAGALGRPNSLVGSSRTSSSTSISAARISLIVVCTAAGEKVRWSASAV